MHMDYQEGLQKIKGFMADMPTDMRDAVCESWESFIALPKGEDHIDFSRNGDSAELTFYKELIDGNGIAYGMLTKIYRLRLNGGGWRLEQRAPIEHYSRIK